MALFKGKPGNTSHFFSIRAKLIYGFLFLVFFASFLFGGLSIYAYQLHLTEAANSRLQTVGLTRASQLDFWLNEIQSDLFQTFDIGIGLLPDAETLLTVPDVQVTKNLHDLMDNFLILHPSFFEVFLIHPDTGVVIGSTTHTSQNVSKADRSYFISGKEGFFSTGIYFSEALQRDALTVAGPLKDSEGRLLAVVAGRVNLAAMNDILSDRTSLGVTGETYLLDTSGTILAGIGSAPAYWMDAGRDSDLIVDTYGFQQGLMGKKGHSIYTNYLGREVLGNHEFLESFNSVLLVEQNTDEVYAPVWAFVKRLVFFLMVTLLVTVFVAVLLSFLITEPIAQLTELAGKVALGNLDLRSKIKSNDEIGLLAQNFNQMTTSLVGAAKRYQDLLESLPIAVFVADSRGNIVFSNGMAAKLTGFPRDELANKVFFNLIHDPDGLFHPDELMEKNILSDIQLHLNVKKSRPIPVSLSGVALKSTEQTSDSLIFALKDMREWKRYAHERVQTITPVLLRISLGDFTSRVDIPDVEDEFTDLLVAADLMSRNLEVLIDENTHKTRQVMDSSLKIRKTKTIIEKERAKVEALIQSLGEAILAIDLKGRIIMMNDVAEKLFGTSIQKVMGEKYEDHFEFYDEHHELIRVNSFPLVNVVKERRQLAITTHFKPKGKEIKIPLATTISPIMFGDKMLGIIGTFRDITKEVEIDRAKTEFVSLASHQLRTPATSIKWLLQEIMRKGSLTKWQKEYLTDALDSNKRMIGLVNDLLNISRIEAGIISIESVEVDLYDFVENLVKEARIVAREKRQRIVLKKPCQSLRVSLDETLMQQVLSNLISNAIHYSLPGTSIEISFAKIARRVQIKVADQGIGISKEDQKMLFTKFFRAAESSHYSTTGSGLGLYLVKEILRHCHGHITVQSAKGQGSAFTVNLPLKGPVSNKGVKLLIEHQIS